MLCIVLSAQTEQYLKDILQALFVCVGFLFSPFIQFHKNHSYVQSIRSQIRPSTATANHGRTLFGEPIYVYVYIYMYR
jgi:hypothetical protein